MAAAAIATGRRADHTQFVTQVTAELNHWLLECDQYDALAHAMGIDVDDHDWYDDGDAKNTATAAATATGGDRKKVVPKKVLRLCLIVISRPFLLMIVTRKQSLMVMQVRHRMVLTTVPHLIVIV